MREIKFRAWDKYNKDMVFESDWTTNKSENCPMLELNGRLVDMMCDRDDYLDYNIMQYTGLKDKNSVDIYEGDIVLYGATNSIAIYAVCVFKNAKFQWEVHDIDDIYLDYDLLNEEDNEWCKVIGNIHENPELLEKSND